MSEDDLARLFSTPAGLAWTLSEGAWVPARHLVLVSEVMCQLYQERDRGVVEHTGVIIEMPPRHGKTMLCSHYIPVHFLNRYPEKKIILTGTERASVAERSRFIRDVVAKYPDLLQCHLDPRTRGLKQWNTLEGGELRAIGMGGPIVGHGADLFVVDDPIKNPREALSAMIREAHWNWWASVAMNRLEPLGIVLIIMHRWHEDDLIGRIMDTGEREKWFRIRLPAIAEDEAFDGVEDGLRRKPGEALWPERWPVHILEDRKRKIATWAWNAQFQQRPSSAGGQIIKRELFRRYHKAPTRFDEMIQSWDMSFKDTKTADYVVCHVWGRIGMDRYLLCQVRDRMDFNRAVKEVRQVSVLYPQSTRTMLIEPTANGPAIIAHLKNEFPGLRAEPAKGSKESRAHSAALNLAQGHYFVPDWEKNPWVEAMLERMARFPNTKYDDEIDAFSQAMNYWDGTRGKPVYETYSPALSEVPMEWSVERTLYRGWSLLFRRPGCVWAQFDSSNRLCFVGEAMNRDCSVDEFARADVLTRFREMEDAAEDHTSTEMRGGQAGSVDTAGIEAMFGLDVYPIDQPSDPWRRQRMVKYLLLQRADGLPGILIDPVACPVLVEGLRGAYAFADTGSEENPQRNPLETVHLPIMTAFEILVEQLFDHENYRPNVLDEDMDSLAMTGKRPAKGKKIVDIARTRRPGRGRG